MLSCWQNARKEGLGFSSRLRHLNASKGIKEQLGRNAEEIQGDSEDMSVITTVQMLHFLQITDQDWVPVSVYSRKNHLAW